MTAPKKSSPRTSQTGKKKFHIRDLPKRKEDVSEEQAKGVKGGGGR